MAGRLNIFGWASSQKIGLLQEVLHCEADASLEVSLGDPQPSCLTVQWLIHPVQMLLPMSIHVLLIKIMEIPPVTEMELSVIIAVVIHAGLISRPRLATFARFEKVFPWNQGCNVRPGHGVPIRSGSYCLYLQPSRNSVRILVEEASISSCLACGHTIQVLTSCGLNALRCGEESPEAKEEFDCLALGCCPADR